jgi:hypothetical protein
MAYTDVAALTADQEFNARLAAAATTEALGRADPLSDLVLKNPPPYVAGLFGPTVAASPGFGDKYAGGGQEAVTDGDLLSAVQANWARLSGLYAPA